MDSMKCTSTDDSIHYQPKGAAPKPKPHCWCDYCMTLRGRSLEPQYDAIQANKDRVYWAIVVMTFLFSTGLFSMFTYPAVALILALGAAKYVSTFLPFGS